MTTATRIPLKYAEMHAPFFIYSEKSGRSLGTKLKVAERPGMVLEYDQEHDKLHVWLDGMYGCGGPVANYHPFEIPIPECQAPKVAKPVVTGDTTQRNAPQEAQVSTPFGHVFAGPGQGQTGQEAPVKRGPGRPPKS